MAVNKYTVDQLKDAVKQADNKAQVLKILGMSASGSAYRYLSSKIDFYNLDTSHWYSSEHSRVSQPLKEILVAGSSYTNTNKLKKRLIKDGLLEAKCSIELCQLSEWLGKPLVLQLDHINGVNNDNRIENLRLLCPNCHTQTDTWGMKKRGGSV